MNVVSQESLRSQFDVIVKQEGVKHGYRINNPDPVPCESRDRQPLNEGRVLCTWSMASGSPMKGLAQAKQRFLAVVSGLERFKKKLLIEKLANLEPTPAKITFTVEWLLSDSSVGPLFDSVADLEACVRRLWSFV